MSDRAWLILVALWVTAASWGFVLVNRYEFTPGRAARPVALWPQASRIQPETKRATVVLAGHPRCPCTRSTLSELERIQAQVPGGFRLHVLFYEPPGAGPDWQTGISWMIARGLADTTLWADPDSRDARLFDAWTSGQVVAYNAQGRQIFTGGITGSRGHAGDNEGADQLVRALRGERLDERTHQVFGCSLRETDRNEGDETLCQPR